MEHEPAAVEGHNPLDGGTETQLTMANDHDDLDAVRAIVEALDPFDEGDRDRILRWACEKLGLAVPGAAPTPAPQAPSPDPPPAIPDTPPQDPPASGQDIKSFVQSKNPSSANQLAAVVAYYHQFVAPENERKDAINKDDLVDACRTADRARPQRPDQVLVNAFNVGYFDRGERGHYTLNAVGENLVAMVLPVGENQATSPSGSTRRRATKKKAPKKKARSRKKTKTKSAKKKGTKKRGKSS